MPKKRRFAVSIRTQSVAVYEVKAVSREEAMRLSHDYIRSQRQLTFHESTEVNDAMEITGD